MLADDLQERKFAMVEERGNRMKKLLAVTFIASSAAFWLSGCGTDLRVGGGTKNIQQPATVGQQLVDLQKAKDAGALTDAEFQAQKAKILSN